MKFPHRLPRSGDDVDLKNYPWFIEVHITYADGHVSIHGGTIINSKTVLTSFDTEDRSWKYVHNVYVVPDVSNRADYIEVAGWSYHEEKDNRYSYISEDRVVVKKNMVALDLREPVKLGFKSAPVCVGSLQNIDEASVKTIRAVVVNDKVKHQVMSSILLSTQQCKDLLRSDYSEGLICSENKLAIDDAEQYDYYTMTIGSPLFVKMRNNYYQLGVLLYHHFDEKKRTIYLISAGVQKDVDWIHRSVEEDEECS